MSVEECIVDAECHLTEPWKWGMKFISLHLRQSHLQPSWATHGLPTLTNKKSWLRNNTCVCWVYGPLILLDELMAEKCTRTNTQIVTSSFQWCFLHIIPALGVTRGGSCLHDIIVFTKSCHCPRVIFYFGRVWHLEFLPMLWIANPQKSMIKLCCFWKE